MQANIILIRTVFTLTFAAAGYLIQPIPGWVGETLHLPGGSRLLSAVAGVILACGIILFELRIRRASLKALLGAAAGSILGIIGSTLMGFLITAQPWDQPVKSFLTLTLTLFMAYVGLLVGAAKGDYLDLSALGGILSDRSTKLGYRILEADGPRRLDRCRLAEAIRRPGPQRQRTDRLRHGGRQLRRSRPRPQLQ